MNRIKLEQAINGLKRLLKDNVNVEERYQKYLEDNPIIFQVLGYEASFPKKRLFKRDGTYIEPDFIIRKPSGLYDIFELKTPQERLIKDKKNRETLYANIDEYLSQVDTYHDYFDDAENREHILEEYSLDIQKKPNLVILVGLDAAVDKKLLHLLVKRRTNSLTIITFDELLSLLYLHHASLFNSSEHLPGASWHAALTLHRVDVSRCQYIFDAGDNTKKNRWSIFLDERNILHFEIIDLDGNSHIVSTKPGSNSFNFGEPFYLCCEFGNSDNFFVMQMLVNNRIMALYELAYPINLSAGLDFSRRVIAADITEKNFGTLDMAALAIYNITLTFPQRSALAEYFFDQLFPETDLSKILAKRPRYVAPNEGKYLFIGEKSDLK